MQLNVFILQRQVAYSQATGRGIQFDDIKLKVPSEYKRLILKRNSYLNVNKSLSSTRWATLYTKQDTFLSKRWCYSAARLRFEQTFSGEICYAE